MLLGRCADIAGVSNDRSTKAKMRIYRSITPRIRPPILQLCRVRSPTRCLLVRLEALLGTIWHRPRSELQLNAGLEKLRIAFEIESVKVSIAIGHLQPHIFGEVPVDHRRDSPEGASMHTFAVEIGIGVSQHCFPCSGSSAEHSPLRRYVLETTIDRVVGARLAR